MAKPPKASVHPDWRAYSVRLLIILLVTLTEALSSAPARAFSIELRDVAPMRIERQRSYALKPPEPRKPKPNTAAISTRDTRLGLKERAPAYIRLFKATSELEVWLQGKDGHFVLFKRYPICFWSGTLGPKTSEGDGQTPEGFYVITRRSAHWSRKWSHAFNLGFPNSFDRKSGRSGSYILLHGGCSSIGCFSMTNAIMAEIHFLVREALRGGQRRVHVHIFPFRMTAANLKRHAASPWTGFWHDLKTAYDSFETTRAPPEVALCRGRYVVRDGDTDQNGDPGRLKRLPTGVAQAGSSSKTQWTCVPAPKSAEVGHRNADTPAAKARGFKAATR